VATHALERRRAGCCVAFLEDWIETNQHVDRQWHAQEFLELVLAQWRFARLPLNKYLIDILLRKAIGIVRSDEWFGSHNAFSSGMALSASMLAKHAYGFLWTTVVQWIRRTSGGYFRKTEV